eukprot:TRINITY_DN9476_c0_g1::TRINITY_DN9476_c0_g1_i1::g.209::m.209 TRINITY_DN9476_c0_g1::TRINITY_DN9476_c0_g1_i1::g.209  ORF type:complete len:310 (-),score=8.08,sp/A7MB75/TM231_BOVIN/37.92/2e-56,TM231/PF10149.4/6.6e-51 TRINITY_DN9476_c0_g1_i1:33-962(-)
MVVVWKSQYEKRHIAPFFSLAVWFKILLWLAVIILPYVICLFTYSFWMKENSFRAQPDVEYKHQAIVILEGSDPTNYLFWSTNSSWNEVMINHYRPSLLLSSEDDWNRDGKKDSLHFNLTVPLSSTEDVYHVKLLLFFQYALEKRVRLVMESLAYIDYNAATSGMGLWSDGVLTMRQNKALSVDGIRDRYNTSLVNTTLPVPTIGDLQIERILKTYIPRNETTYLEPVYHVWTSRSSSLYNSFNLDVTIRYSPQVFYYDPEFWETIKFAWIQYTSVLALLAIPAFYVMKFAYENQILTTIVKHPKMKIS